MSEAGSDEDIVARAQARLGTVLRGKYRLDRVLGIGGMATVYAATHRNSTEFAVKVLHPDLCLRSELRTRFLREGHAASAVKHAGAVAVLDDDVAEDGSAFLVMELLRGESVENLWERRQHRLPLKLVAGMGIQLLDVLAAAHARGVIHRDIKPANLFLTHQGQIKVLDFGIARLRDMAASHATQTGMMMGTPAFMAPEQALAKTSEIDAQTDVWAAGATMFTLTCGKLVHEAENAQQIMIRAATTRAPLLASVSPDVPPLLCEVIDQALAFEKAERWSGAAAMREALRNASRSVFGSVPTAETLVEILEELGEEATVIQSSPLLRAAELRISAPASEEVTARRARDESQPSQPAITQPLPSTPAPAMRFRGAPVAELATVNPVSTDAPKRARAIGGVRLPPALIGAALGALALMIVGIGLVIFFVARSSSRTDVSSAGATASSSPSVAPSPPVPDATDTAPAAPTASLQVVQVDQLPSVPGSPSAKPTAATTTAAAPAPASPKPNCTPPYTFDAQGNRKWKRECLR
jgi:serine/threonine protein kinase